MNELDERMIEYLSLLDSYQSSVESLSKCIKRSHFQLSQAKLALGPIRLSEHSYDLSPHSSHLLVYFTPLTSVALSPTLTLSLFTPGQSLNPLRHQQLSLSQSTKHLNHHSRPTLHLTIHLPHFDNALPFHPLSFHHPSAQPLLQLRQNFLKTQFISSLDSPLHL